MRQFFMTAVAAVRRDWRVMEWPIRVLIGLLLAMAGLSLIKLGFIVALVLSQ